VVEFKARRKGAKSSNASIWAGIDLAGDKSFPKLQLTLSPSGEGRNDDAAADQAPPLESPPSERAARVSVGTAQGTGEVKAEAADSRAAKTRSKSWRWPRRQPDEPLAPGQRWRYRLPRAIR
jgi:hypothetical protein